MHGLDVVAVGVEHVRGVVARVVAALPGRSVVTASGRESSLVERVHRLVVAGLEREMESGRRVVVIAREQLVGREVPLSF